MCGRYTLRTSPKLLASSLGVEDLPLFNPRYNIAPTQFVLAARLREDRPAREAVLLKWGLIPSWAKDPAIGNRCINARADGVADKPSFRAAFKRRRCLIAADSFYEWQKVGSKKQPWLFQLQGGTPFAFAGLWETRKPPDGEPVESCAIITTEANGLVKSVHERMPVILSPDDYDAWLAPAEDARRLLTLLGPFPAGKIEAFPVGLHVNNPRNDDPACVEPLAGGKRFHALEGPEPAPGACPFSRHPAEAGLPVPAADPHGKSWLPPR
jgi:putative SOS response-associated peptidase YedK